MYKNYCKNPVHMSKDLEVLPLKGAQNLARVISNSTAQQIIEYISSHKNCSASQIAKDLSIPASTVHYHVQAILKAKIITSDEFHYSSKGKEVAHYQMTKKVIIIIPEESQQNSTFMTQLKSFLPGTLIVALLAIGIAIRKFLFGGLKILSKGLTKTAEYSTADTIHAVARSEQIRSAIESARNETNFLLGLIIGAVIIILAASVFALLKKK